MLCKRLEQEQYKLYCLTLSVLFWGVLVALRAYKKRLAELLRFASLRRGGIIYFFWFGGGAAAYSFAALPIAA